MADERTRAPRYQVGGMSVVYDTGDGFWSAPVIDCSESGLYVETHHEVAIGTRVTIMPEVESDESKLPYEVHAEVVRSNEYDPDNHFDRVPGLAFRFVGMSDENIQHLRRFLQAHGAQDRLPVKK